MEETQKTNTNRNKIIIGIVLILVLVGAYLFMDRRSSEGESGIVSENQNATSTEGDITAGGNGQYTIEKVAVEYPMPNLDRPITIHSKATLVTKEATASATPVIKDLQAKLKKDPSDFHNWVGLGLAQKEAGDYDGAILSWEFASRIAPSDHIALGNIANLYAYFLGSASQAESYYKQAIGRAPTQSNLYVQLADVYITIMGDKAKARAIIDQGLAKIPNDPNLLQLKASLN